MKIPSDIFNILAQNIHCGYTLEPPRGSNEYPQCLFWIKNKKIRFTPSNPSFCYIKVGFEGVCIARTCFPDEIRCYHVHGLSDNVIFCPNLHFIAN